MKETLQNHTCTRYTKKQRCCACAPKNCPDHVKNQILEVDRDDEIAMH